MVHARGAKPVYDNYDNPRMGVTIEARMTTEQLGQANVWCAANSHARFNSSPSRRSHCRPYHRILALTHISFDRSDRSGAGATRSVAPRWGEGEPSDPDPPRGRAPIR